MLSSLREHTVDHCAAALFDADNLRSPQHRQQHSFGILQDIVEPDVRVAGRSSPAGHWLSAFLGIHRPAQSIVCWYSGSGHATWPEISNDDIVMFAQAHKHTLLARGCNDQMTTSVVIATVYTFITSNSQLLV